MAMFSRFFVLGPRGDTLIVKEYQGHISPKTATPQDFWSRSAISIRIRSNFLCITCSSILCFVRLSFVDHASRKRQLLTIIVFRRVQEHSELSPVIDINGVRKLFTS